MKMSRRKFLAASAAGAAGIPSLAGPAGAGEAPADPADPGRQFQMRPVGRIEVREGATRIRIFEPYVEGLLGLDQWSHIDVLYWFDRNDVPERRRVLRVHPQGDAKNPMTGVFACRSPVRPNLIALSVCKVVSIEGPLVTVDGIDAMDGTPVLDIKPLIPPDITVKDLRMPEWARRGREAEKGKKEEKGEGKAAGKAEAKAKEPTR